VVLILQGEARHVWNHLGQNLESQDELGFSLWEDGEGGCRQKE
jgi:hypothetical protein